MPTFQQVSSSNFCPASAAPVNCKWKCLRATTAQPRSGRPHKLTERDCRVLKCVALSSVATLTTEFQTASGSNVSTELFVGSFMKWFSMAEQPQTSLRSPCTMPSVGWSSVKLSGNELRSECCNRGQTIFTRYVLQHSAVPFCELVWPTSSRLSHCCSLTFPLHNNSTYS